MSLSARAQYACLALLELARHYETQPQTPLTVQSICRRHNVSHPFLRQILNRLRAGGLVTSARGAGGGYALAVPPEQISLRDILDALGESWELAPDESAATDNPARAVLSRVWADVNQALAEKLSSIRLADLAQQYRRALEQTVGEPDWVI